MNRIFWTIGFLMIGEVLLHVTLFAIGKAIGNKSRDRITPASALKGVMERTFVVVVLQSGFASALTLLGALKIATRIKDEDNKVTNDFFLMGNLVSILFAIGYNKILTIEF